MSGSDASRFIALNLKNLYRDEELNLSEVRDHDALIRYIHDNTPAIFELNPQQQLQLIAYAFAKFKPNYHWQFLDFSVKPDPFVQLVHGLFSSKNTWLLYSNAKRVQALMLESTRLRDQVLREVTWPAAFSVLSSLADSTTDIFIDTAPTQSEDEYQEQIDAGLISLRMMIESKNIDYAKMMAMHNLFYIDTCFDHLLKSETPKGDSLREAKSALAAICANITPAERCEKLQQLIKGSTPKTKPGHLERLKLIQQVLKLANTEISPSEFLEQKSPLLEAIRQIRTSYFHSSYKGAEISMHLENLTLKQLRHHSETLLTQLNIKLRTTYSAAGGGAGTGAGAEPEPTDDSGDEPDDFINMMGGLMKRAASDLSEGGTRWSTSNPMFSHHCLEDDPEAEEKATPH